GRRHASRSRRAEGFSGYCLWASPTEQPPLSGTRRRACSFTALMFSLIYLSTVFLIRLGGTPLSLAIAL
ncbi:MAG: hypothetical protein ACXQTZ_02965, partial [Candidatus Alkanophagales archaeon]